jgi:lactam utilization protein B
MKCTILAALAATTLLAGCATNAQQQGEAYADAGYTPVGTNIPRKKAPSLGDGVTQIDKQALENDRTMGSATVNLPSR